MEGAENVNIENKPPIKPPEEVIKKPPEVTPSTPFTEEIQVKPDPQARLEDELRNFNGTLERLQILVTTGLGKKENTAITENPQAESEKREPEKAPTPVEIKAKMDNLLRAIQGMNNTFDASIKAVTEETLPIILKEINSFPGQGTERLNELIEAATSKVQAARTVIEQEPSLAEFTQLEDDYKRALLAEANTVLDSNFDSFDQLLNAETQRIREAHALGSSYFWTGRFFNRERIKELDGKRQVIGSFFDRKMEAYHAHESFYSAFRSPNSHDLDGYLRRITVEITKPIVEKMLSKYDELTEELKRQKLPIREPEIPETLKDSLDTTFIGKYFIPYLNKAADNYVSWTSGHEDPRYIQEAIDIARSLLKLRHDRSFSPPWNQESPEEEAKSQELSKRLGELPLEVRGTVEHFIEKTHRFRSRPMEESYRTIARLIQTIPTVERQTALVNCGNDFLNRVEAVVNMDNTPYSLQTISRILSEKRHDLYDPDTKIEPLMADFLSSIDNMVWLNFINNPEAQRIFGAEQLTHANQCIARALIKFVTLKSYPEKTSNISNYQTPPDVRIKERLMLESNVGYRLLDFKTSDTIPFIILNAYRDTQSKSSDILPYNIMPNLESTAYYQFIAGITDHELNQLRQQNIPGLVPLIEFFKVNPNPLGPTVWDKESNTFHSNPAFREININLIEMSVHLLDKGDKYIKEFVRDVFDNYISVGTVLEAFSQIQQERGGLPMNFSSALMRRLRRFDPLLQEQYRNENTSIQDPIPEESCKLFNQSINRLLNEANNPESAVYKSWKHFSNEWVLGFIARQPERVEEVFNLPLSAPYLFSVLLKEGGPLYTNRGKIMENIFANGNVLKRAKEIETIFSKKVPYWKQLYFFTDARIGEELAAATSEYPITDVLGIPLKKLIERHRTEKQKNPAGFTRLQAMIKNSEVLQKLESGELDYIPFASLNGVYKRLIFRDLLKRSVALSRDPEQKARAGGRNMALAAKGFTIPESTYIHGSAANVIESVLLNGNLPQEALGEGASTDSYPFHTDFSCLTQEYISSQPNIEEVFDKSISGKYGSRSALGADGQLFYIYRRTPDAYEGGKKYGPKDNHSLILGGMPATEISGIALRNADATLETVKKAILENGFYIPVYDLNGSLLFTPENYDSLRTNLNYTVPVEVWDYSLKTGEQLGSNPGGEFTVPTEQGPIKYYVKFSSPESTDQIWNEELADSIYRHLGIAVPDTKIVKIDTAYGHSSQVLPQDAEIKMDDLKNGFIADALLANWDIVGNTGNVIFSGRRLIRIDNGGSLLFRARGERKTTFNGIVTELEGMKSSYTGLTQEDIQNQLAVLKERLTDATIDRLVESVRLSFQDRENLKDTLRQRRDYILSYYSAGHEASETKEITDEGKLVESSLRTEIFDDATISAAVPEWRKLTGEEGYQHNGVLLGEHIKNAVSALKYLPEYWSLSDREKGLALVSALFHDIGKPTGRRDEKVPRDFEHEIPSARKAAEYTRKWGYSEADTQTVVQVIINDGIVSDIARDKVRDERKKLTPQQLKNVLDGNPSVLKILRAVNRADVIATVGAEGFNAIADAYNRYFDETLNE